MDAIAEQAHAFRKGQKQPLVASVPKLMVAARAFALYTARTGRYGHTSGDRSPTGYATARECGYGIVLENVAYVYNSTGFDADALADEFVKGRKDSPGPPKNRLEPDLTETSVALARSEQTGYYYAVQMFGRPKSAATTFQVDNEVNEALEYTLGERSCTLEPRYTRADAVCRPAEVTFWLPDEKTESAEPTIGAHITAVRYRGELFLQMR